MQKEQTLLSKFDQRFQVFVGAADVEALAIDHQSHEAVLLAQAVECGGQLELAAFPDVVLDVSPSDNRTASA